MIPDFIDENTVQGALLKLENPMQLSTVQVTGKAQMRWRILLVRITVEVTVPKTCVVAVQLASIVKAIEVCIADAGDVYVNYSMSGLPEAHASYHASGQQHIKKGGKYIEWDGGPSGTLAPMRLLCVRPREVITRSDCGSTIGWEVAKLATVLPVLTETADMLVDARALPHDSTLAFRVDVIGQWAKQRRSVSGFPILQRHRFGGAVRVEVSAFAIAENGDGVVWLEDF